MIDLFQKNNWTMFPSTLQRDIKIETNPAEAALLQMFDINRVIVFF